MERMTYEAGVAGYRTPPTFDEAREQGQLAKYFEDWGRPGDGGLIALNGAGKQLGAAWHRLFPDRYRALGEGPSYTPEVIMAVNPDNRGQGAGRRLLEALMEQARGQGTDRLRLHVLKANTVALNLYESTGFIATDEINLQFGTEAAMGLRMSARLGVY